jgi:proteasome accessory factor A
MNGRRMFGVETEYAVTAFDSNGALLSRELCVSHLVRRAEHTVKHLRGGGETDFFLQNGSRFYVDAGQHPEMSSPECLNPWDVVRYSKAGDVIIERLAAGVRIEDARTGQVLVFKGNVDYSGSGSTWGSHESYLHRADADVLRRRLIPHLVSRVIYTGAGGFNPLSPGLEFMLSPRAAHLTQVVSDHSTSNRGIVHTRDESLSAPGYRRQHLICGESLQSDLASWLRVGVTAVIVALIEAGVPCGDDVSIAAPLDALQVFSRDVTCRATTRMTSGPPLTTLQIQRQYLHHASERLDQPFMPPWAREVCEQWSAMLDRLERAPETVARSLDWAIKLALYQDRARRRGVDWEALPAWTHVVATLNGVRRMTTPPVGRLSTALVLAADGPFRERVHKLGPYVEEHRLRWNDLDAFLRLRQELFEVDTRFGQIGAGSLFRRLEASGTLEHGMRGVDAIDYAIEHPPAEGRAHVRGEVIRRVAPDGRKLRCTWTEVVDAGKGTRLDLSDPFTEREIWNAPQSAPATPDSPTASARQPTGSDDDLSLWDDLMELCSRARRGTRE